MQRQTNILDVRDGESKNERPYHAENELEVAVDDVWGVRMSVCGTTRYWTRRGEDGRTLRPDVGELHATGEDELEGFIDVLCLLDAHPRVLVVSPQGDVA